MHRWGTRVLLRHYVEQGVSKAELSRRFRVSRRMIHEWLGKLCWLGANGRPDGHWVSRRIPTRLRVQRPAP